MASLLHQLALEDAHLGGTRARDRVVAARQVLGHAGLDHRVRLLGHVDVELSKLPDPVLVLRAVEIAKERFRFDELRPAIDACLGKGAGAESVRT